MDSPMNSKSGRTLTLIAKGSLVDSRPERAYNRVIATKEREMNVVLNTGGGGYWSNTKTAVLVTDIKLGYVADDKEFGELCVYFDTGTWDVNKLGLIYTDKQFLAELRKFLIQHGLPGKDVDYSEQGMQGDDYVSLDVGAKFLQAWEAKFNAFNTMAV
jgi:hypothetical protein